MIPTATDFKVIDRFIKVTDQDSAWAARNLARTEGLFMGYTSGAAFQGLKQLQEEGLFDESSKVVVIFPDHGSRYMSKIYNDNWMKEQGFMEEMTSKALKKTN
jgi:cystathionine beta-synthase